jgi:hypothetical protein
MAATYSHGDFSFMDKKSIPLLDDMYNAVNSTDNWDNLRKFIPGQGGFMFCEKPEWLLQIDKAMQYDDHSGFTYGWTIRKIEYIAKHGWDNFVLKQTSTNAATIQRLEILELPYAIQEAELELIAWIKRLENSPDVEALNRLYYRVDETIAKIKGLYLKLSFLCRSHGEEDESHMFKDSLTRIMSTIPPMPPSVVALREPQLPPMPPMGVPLMRSMSGMPAPAPVFRHHPSMTEEENRNADVAERYQPSHQAEAYQMRVYTDALMKRKDLFAADAARES